MSVEQPGSRYSCLATKQVVHKMPTVEKRHPGIALKSAQVAPMVPTMANATAAQTITVGEEMVIAMTGVWTVPTSALPGGAVVGDGLWITIADNVLVLAAVALTAGVVEAPYIPYGVIDEIDTTAGEADINLNLRDTL